MRTDPHNCGDCAVKPGEPHTGGCDVARCLETGDQRLSCGEDHDHGRDIWTGVWPGEAECIEFGWYSVFTERGWVRLRGELLGTQGQRLHVRFEVQDTGPGITPENQSRLFTTFEQGGKLQRKRSRPLPPLLVAQLARRRALSQGARVGDQVGEPLEHALLLALLTSGPEVAP